MSAKKLPPILTVKEILRLYKIQARKNLSQNFLLDMNMVRKIVRSASFIQDHHVVEVGPGPGGITQALLMAKCKHLTVIEKDSRFMPALKMLANVYENMDIIHGDILKFDMGRLFPEELKTPWASKPPPIHIIGNLPFNVSTPLIIRWLRDISYQRGAWSYGRTRLTLTFQKEVAERMVALIASDERCRLSMMCQHLCNVKLNFIIPGKVFVPAPEVDVGVVSFVPLIEPKIKLPFELVEKVMRHVFHHRNKKCRYGIRTLFPKEHWYFADEILEKSAVNPVLPSYNLSMEELDKICHAYNDICKTVPGIISYDYRAAPVERIMKEQEITSLILAQGHI
ncbi:dimethyladenosine transferase 1, mitochondrial [Octopus bimaculoides]|uniref:rRNA adenine N(6)-methyltransferase n=1 Tax=Octopus bimaculoides TaxID=37653 RepID=A0A0L8HX40_OCTBM|nr:dimethyladenosine transferase 1, mitochondrial [Octopus bimaculoides]|eukprot:XP_014768661.1 PREDICTED: dimethyladenosine transferase 1, mitochondrial-like [Octopus bimaculoides]